MTDVLKQESVPATERRLKRYVLPELLVLDEIGYGDAEAVRGVAMRLLRPNSGTTSRRAPTTPSTSSQGI